jgi:hypothetical protein
MCDECQNNIKTIYKQYIIDNWMYTLHIYSFFFKNKQIKKKKESVKISIMVSDLSNFLCQNLRYGNVLIKIAQKISAMVRYMKKKTVMVSDRSKYRGKHPLWSWITSCVLNLMTSHAYNSLLFYLLHDHTIVFVLAQLFQSKYYEIPVLFLSCNLLVQSISWYHIFTFFYIWDLRN